MDSSEHGDGGQVVDNEALWEVEEAIPPMKADELKCGAQVTRQTQGFGADGFHLKVFWILG